MSDALRPTTRGLSPEAAEGSVRAYFAAFRWDPPAIDPYVTSAREFFTRMVQERRAG